MFIFLFFAASLEVTGGGKAFLSFAIAFFGHLRGGPAKAAVVGSALSGTISGSAAANVAGSGFPRSNVLCLSFFIS